MHTQWIDPLERAVNDGLQLLQAAASQKSSAWIDLPLARLKDAGERINSLKASATSLRGRGDRAAQDGGGPPGTQRDDQIRKFERYQQLNALRIAIIDLNEICEDLTQSYWVCALGFASSDGVQSVVDQVMGNASLRKGLRGSCGALLSEGHSHLNRLRNALSHFAFTEYEARVIDDEPTALIKASFKLTQVAQIPKTPYYDDIFNPFCQLGERHGSGDDDFSRSNRNGLNAALFSAGRLTADMAASLHDRLKDLTRPASVVVTASIPSDLSSAPTPRA